MRRKLLEKRLPVFLCANEQRIKKFDSYSITLSSMGKLIV